MYILAEINCNAMLLFDMFRLYQEQKIVIGVSSLGPRELLPRAEA